MSEKTIDVRYVAELARIALTEDEISHFQPQLENILKYVEQLQKADIEGVETTIHATPVFNVLREDTPRKGLEKDAALANAPHAANGLVIVTKVIE